MRILNDLIEISHNAVLGGKVSLKLNGAGWLGPLVDTFLTAVQCTFTVSLRPQSITATRTPVLPVEPFVEGL
jgi:hypothetical protein